MDKFSLKNGIHKGDRLSKSTAGVDGVEHLHRVDDNETDDSTLMNRSVIIAGSDSGLMNESLIISGSMMNDIHDISNNCINDDLNTNIDALMPDKKDIFPDDKTDVDLLDENAVESLKSQCTRGYTHPFPCNKSDLYMPKSLDTVETPEVEITSCEDGNGKFRVRFHIKNVKK